MQVQTARFKVWRLLFSNIAHVATTARRLGNAHAVLARKFRAATKNSCDTVVAEFFEVN